MIPLTSIDDYVNQIHTLGKGVPQIDVMETDDAAFTFRPLQRLATFQRLLTAHLILVELGKVIDNNGNGQRDHQNTTNATHAAYDLPQWGSGIDVPVTDGRHRDARPPKRLRYADELGAGFLLLGKVRQTRENQHAHREEQHQQPEFLVRVTQRETQRLQPGRVPSQLQNTKDTHDTEDLYHTPHILELIRCVLVRFEQEQRHEIRHYG